MIPLRPLQVTVGLALVAAVPTGRAALLVRPWFFPVVVVAGALLLAAAVRTTATARVRPAVALLLLLPVLGGATLTPELVGRIPAPAGAEATGIGARLGDGDNPLLVGDDGTDDVVTLLDVVLAEQQVGAAALDGRRVVLEGTVDDAGRLSRLVMVCCAADARPVTVPVTGSLPPAGQWVRVIGTLTADGRELVVEVEEVTTIDTPSDPLL